MKSPRSSFLFRSAAFSIIALIALPQMARAQTITSVFSYTGTNQTFIVPSGVTSLTVKLWGAGGGYQGGSGAFVTGLLAVTPSDALPLIIGGGS